MWYGVYFTPTCCNDVYNNLQSCETIIKYFHFIFELKNMYSILIESKNFSFFLSPMISYRVIKEFIFCLSVIRIYHLTEDFEEFKQGCTGYFQRKSIQKNLPIMMRQTEKTKHFMWSQPSVVANHFEEASSLLGLFADNLVYFICMQVNDSLLCTRGQGINDDLLPAVGPVIILQSEE